MANLSAIALRDRQVDERNLPVALQQPQSNLRIVSFDPTGPGRLLHKAYVIAGHHFKNALGKAAHKLGKGPAATSCRIERAFGADSVTRQSRLDSVYDSFEGIATDDERLLCEVKKDCRKLLDYALPSESLITQVQTFRTIVLLITRYPGLRRFFIQSPKLRRVSDSSDAICALWRSKEYHYDKESDTALDFAAYCVAENDINAELERIRPSELGRVNEEGLGIVDKLVVGYCQGGSGFSRSITIRYLAGILQLPGFWGADYQLQKFTVDKLCRQTTCFIEDNNPDSLTADDFRKLGLSSDLVGIDHLAAAILAGVGAWIERKPAIPGLTSEQWLRSFIKLVQLLRELITHDLFPLASQLAKGNWEALFERVALRVAIPTSHYGYEDFYIVIWGSQPTWSPSDIKAGAPDVQDEGMASLREFASDISRVSDTAQAGESSDETVERASDGEYTSTRDSLHADSFVTAEAYSADDPAYPSIILHPRERQPSPPSTNSSNSSYSTFNPNDYFDPAYWGPGGPPAATSAGVGAHANKVDPTRRPRQGPPRSATSPTVGTEVNELLSEMLGLEFSNPESTWRNAIVVRNSWTPSTASLTSSAATVALSHPASSPSAPGNRPLSSGSSPSRGFRSSSEIVVVGSHPSAPRPASPNPPTAAFMNPTAAPGLEAIISRYLPGERKSISRSNSRSGSRPGSIAQVRRSPSPHKLTLQPATEEDVPVLFYVRALYDYSATAEEEFDFQEGDIIAVTSTPDDGWWIGELQNERRQKGRNAFPSNFVAFFS